MADKADAKDSSKVAATSTRKVKNPETFRERALKASEQSQQPDRRSRIRSVAGKPARPIAGIAKKASGNKVLRVLAKPFRLLGRILFPKYFRNSYRELRQVQWPDRRESRQLTFAVLAFAFVFGAFVAILDFGLDKLFRGVLLK
ncbi:MAG: preprotein translocase subunit SecE [Patescibacteria group bacterium]|nr:preprotein translocase subunit SecE [Patescibacteria group bacterium]